MFHDICLLKGGRSWLLLKQQNALRTGFWKEAYIVRANEWAVAPVECFAIFQSRLFSPKGYFLVCFLPLTQWPTYRSYHCTQWRQSGPVWKWTGRAGAFTRNESEADKSSSFKIRLALCTLCRLYLKFLSNWAPKGNCIVVNGYVWWRQNPPENNVQLIVTQTAALFCSPAPVQENRIVFWL